MRLSLFTDSITGSAASGINVLELEAEKVHRVSKVIDWTVNRDHFITTDFVIPLAKLDHSSEARLKVIKTMESACISAFGY